MFYPEEFKAKVKKAYPNSPLLHQRLDSGDKKVGLSLQANPELYEEWKQIYYKKDW